MFRMCLASRGPLGPLSFGRGIGAGSERDLQVLSGQGWPRAGGLRAGDEGMPVDKPCLKAVEEAFGGDANYAQLHKVYGYDANDTRYSPAPCIGCDMKTVSGVPDPKHVSTSFVGRQDLSIRTWMWRFTRPTNGFSKKLENHGHAVALYFLRYNSAGYIRLFAPRASGLKFKLHPYPPVPTDRLARQARGRVMVVIGRLTF